MVPTMSKIIILRGNSACGKSTTAKALQKRIGNGTLLISQDNVRREMLWEKTGQHNQTLSLLKNLVVYGYQNCEVSILEGILSTGTYDDLFSLIKKTYNQQILAYYFDMPFEETMRRHSQKSYSHEVGEIQLRNWWREKDLLKNICEKMICKEMNTNDIVELIYQDLTGESMHEKYHLCQKLH